MGGQSVFTGAEYQASVAAAVMAHMVAETRLNWVEPHRDEPVTITGETGGIGDDLRIGFARDLAPLEVQAKRRLVGRSELTQTLSEIAARAETFENTGSEVALVLGAGSSVEITDRFATDVRHFRQGRSDLRPITSHVLTTVASADGLLKRLRVLPLDFSSLAAAGTQAALANLRLVLASAEEAESAWDTLVSEGVRVCKGGQATRKDIRDLLLGRGFALKAVGVDARWDLQLDGIRDLIRRDRPRTARVLLEDLAKELQGKPVSSLVLARLSNYLGVVRLHTDSIEMAAEDFSRALELLPRPKASAVLTLLGAPAPGVNWADTTINYSVALYALGRNSDAAAALEEVFTANLARPNAYGLEGRIAFTLRKAPRNVPAEVVNSPDYREHLAILAIMREDWQEAAEISNALIAEGHGPARLLALRAQALVNFATGLTDEANRRARFLEAERAATVAIDRLEETELDVHLLDALSSRAVARIMLGDQEGGDADYSRIGVIDPANSNLIRRKVFELEAAGRETEALQILSDTLVDKKPDLQLLRALIAGSSGELKGARADIEEVLARADAAGDPLLDNRRMEIAEVATRIPFFDIAERALQGVAEAGRVVFYRVLQSRIAFGRGEVDRGVIEYRSAADAAENAKEREDVLLELAAALATAGHFAESAIIYKEAGGSAPTHRAFRQYVKALMKAEHYEIAENALCALEQRTVDAGGSVSDLPEWALRMAVHIASRQELFPKVVHYAEPLARLENSAEAWLDLADAYIRIGNETPAQEILRVVIGRADLQPELRMTAANLLQKTSLRDEAIAESFRALRDKPDDKQMIMNFIGLVLNPAMQGDAIDEALSGEAASGTETLEEEVEGIEQEQGLAVVAGDTWVQLEAKGADPIEYLIYAEPPADSGRGEYLVSDPAVADILGKPRGSLVVRNAGQWNERQYRVKLILPALVHVLRYHMRTFEARFPDTQFIQQYHVGERPTLESLAPILAAMRSSNQHRDKIWAMYAQQRLPLALIAKGLREPLSHVLAMIAGSDRLQYTQAPDTSGLEASVSIASNATRVVLTRQALEAVRRLELLEQLLNSLDVLIPESLMAELESEISEWSEVVKKGRLSMVEATTGFGIIEVKPGEAKPWLDRLRRNNEILKARARILPRPLSTLISKNDDWREKLLGPSSFDAIAIARTNNAALYADDFGLGVVAKNEFGVDSFSTVALVMAWSKSDGDLEKLDDRTIELLRLKHHFVPLRSTTVARALRKETRIAQLVLSRLADPDLDLVSVIVVAAGALRLVALGLITPVSLKEATVLILRALLTHRPPNQVIAPFGAVCRELFRLMPQHLKEIFEASKEVLRTVDFFPTVGATEG